MLKEKVAEMLLNADLTDDEILLFIFDFGTVAPNIPTLLKDEEVVLDLVKSCIKAIIKSREE